MTRRLFLHAGTHKTGTTSIQAMLWKNRRLLAASGTKVVSDSVDVGRRANAVSIAHAFVRPELWTAARIDEGRASVKHADPVVLDRLVRQLGDRLHSTFILSAEAFCFLRTEKERVHLREKLGALEGEIVPLVYFRNRDDWDASWRSQFAGSRAIEKFRSLHPQRFVLLDDWYFDREAIAEFWTGVSRSAVFVDYDEEVRKSGSVLPSFLDICGLPRSLDGPSYFLNRREQHS